MALSRIWSYIILFAIAVAAYRYVQGDKNIFNDIVTERKLKEGESFSKVKYYLTTQPSAQKAIEVKVPEKKLSAANWLNEENIFQSQYIISFTKNTDSLRSALETKIQSVQIISETEFASMMFDSLHQPLIYPFQTSADFTSKPPSDFFASSYVITASPAKDSIRNAMFSTLNRQRIISNNDMAYYLPKNIDGMFETGKFAITLAIGLIGTLALFMGLLHIAEQAGGINLLSRFISPFLSKLFPGVPIGHAAYGHMVMNFSANILGLDNAATPFGLKAMQSLQEINTNKEKASNAQIMFLALHAAGLTLIPVSIIAVRAANGSHNPNEIFIPLMLSTLVCTLTAMLLVSFRQKINVLQPKLFFPVFGIVAFMALFVWFLQSLKPFALEQFSDSFSNGAILLVFFVIVAGGVYKKINLFDAFVEGAKGGFETAVRIIPYMVGMLVAVSMLRTSGAFDMILTPVKNLIAMSGLDSRFAEGLPTALLRPFSAGGARGFMVDAMNTYGPDSFIGKLVSVLQGSSETTFYVVALYFGSVSVKDTRYAIPVMLLADLAGVIFSILICYALWA